MPLLPSTTDALIFDRLDPRDIICYSRTCKEAYQRVEGYWERALDIYSLLSPFFSQDEAQQLRIVQALTGTLISGSTALQFFNRIHYPGSDLDLYVEHRYCKAVALYLQSIGYEFQPRESQPPSLEDAIRTGSLAVNDHREDWSDYEDWHCESLGRGFAGVYNLKRGEQKIQLITAKKSPLDIILKFHSTVVMNVVSYSRAYCLYPKATFHKSLSLICGQCNGAERTSSALRKYISRGWKMVDCFGHEWGASETSPGQLVRLVCYQDTNISSTCRESQVRHLGDSYCWTFKLPDIPTFPLAGKDSSSVGYAWLDSQGRNLSTPLTREEIRTGSQTLESNAWRLSLNRRGFGEMEYKVYRNSHLRFAYCIPAEWHSSYSHQLIAPPGFQSQESWGRISSDLNQELEPWGDTERCYFEAHSYDFAFLAFVKQQFQVEATENAYQYSEDPGRSESAKRMAAIQEALKLAIRNRASGSGGSTDTVKFVWR